MWALLFGFESAVNQFGRWSQFGQATVRIIGCILWSMYVDDGNAVDLEEARGMGQSMIGTLFEALGTPLAKEKQKKMDTQSLFLGVIHDLTEFFLGKVSFRPSQRLLDKIKALLLEILQKGSCTPAQAAKVRGMCGFMAHASASKIGKGGLAPFKQRQYTDKYPWDLSNMMKRSIDYLFAIIEDWPVRIVELKPPSRKPLVVASDAQADPGRSPTGGFIYLDMEMEEKAKGMWTVFDEDMGCMGDCI